MDYDKLLVLADYLEKVPEQNFDMVQWGFPDELHSEIVVGNRDDCYTVGCIAGWTVALFGDERDRSAASAHNIRLTAMKLLGTDLNYEGDIRLLNNMFLMSDTSMYPYVTPPIAAAFIRKFVAEDGATNWWDFLMGENGILRETIDNEEV